MFEFDLAVCINFSNIMKACIDMFCAGVLDIVLDVIKSRGGVSEYCRGKIDFDAD